METKTIIAEKSERLDVYLSEKLDKTRSAVKKLVEDKNVTVNGKVEKAGKTLKEGDEITVVLPDPVKLDLEAENIPLDIIYQDEDIAIINKPQGMTVHAGNGVHGSTLVNALLYHLDSLSGINGVIRPGIVHRIDKDTSGLIIAAKNDFAHQALSAQLSDHSLCREYEAVVRGRMKDLSGTVDAPIGRHPTDRKRMAVTQKNSRPAVTHWEVIDSYRGYTHIRCRLETGRTHQIRVHMASIGHPLLGDFTYGAPSPEKGLEGQCLHAKRLRFVHPRSGEPVELETALPEYFQEVLSKLGNRE